MSAKWNQRLEYRVFEPSEKVTVALFEALTHELLGRVKLPLSCLEHGVRYQNNCQLLRIGKSGAVEKTGKLEVALQFDVPRNGGVVAVANKYLTPLRPDKWYLSPLSEGELSVVIFTRVFVRAPSMLHA